jgi:SNF2 family DNA or RNA helicase
MVDDVEFEANKMSFFARRSALLQICSNPNSIADHYNETPAKILVLDKILEELINLKNEKVIVWSFYTASIEHIMSRYARFKPVRYDGTISESAVRREAVRLFREDLGIKLFVGNPAAAGAGLNLQSARYAVYESMSNQAAHYLQSLDRIHRRGQKRDVEYIILLCEGTIEVSEYKRLILKEEAAQAMLGDTVLPPLTREVMLSELLS